MAVVLTESEQAAVKANQEYGVVGRSLRTSTRPTLNFLPLLCAPV